MINTIVNHAEKLKLVESKINYIVNNCQRSHSSRFHSPSSTFQKECYLPYHSFFSLLLSFSFFSRQDFVFFSSGCCCFWFMENTHIFSWEFLSSFADKDQFYSLRDLTFWCRDPGFQSANFTYYLRIGLCRLTTTNVLLENFFNRSLIFRHH